ncbi:hypothetical protein ADICEAN_03200 [Cesiribacter andamanensis AMV16]|uniref:Uncharacterized protein n=1 Tax=Cesiribacter andamanensis AMV16 TaxID=1279009 RepID=M7N381_9BACT|nr:hypothetical protein ADICEAN_03200 [Cesiribacter andamanensis AMV16]
MLQKKGADQLTAQSGIYQRLSILGIGFDQLPGIGKYPPAALLVYQMGHQYIRAELSIAEHPVAGAGRYFSQGLYAGKKGFQFVKVDFQAQQGRVVALYLQQFPHYGIMAVLQLVELLLYRLAGHRSGKHAQQPVGNSAHGRADQGQGIALLLLAGYQLQYPGNGLGRSYRAAAKFHDFHRQVKKKTFPGQEEGLCMV